MPNITLSVSKEMKQKMDSFPEINWSEVARQAFRQKIEDMEFLKKFKEQSEFTQRDALEFGTELSRKLSKKYLK